MASQAIHDLMLRDQIRTLCYKNAVIRFASNYIKNKIVLDIGCGTGILSCFCAMPNMGGAKQVYSIEGAIDIANHAKMIAKENKLSDKIQIIHGKLENIDLKTKMNNCKADVIVSEWMGNMLLVESMVHSGV